MSGLAVALSRAQRTFHAIAVDVLAAAGHGRHYAVRSFHLRSRFGVYAVSRVSTCVRERSQSAVLSTFGRGLL
jgi:hypothetical protein